MIEGLTYLIAVQPVVRKLRMYLSIYQPLYVDSHESTRSVFGVANDLISFFVRYAVLVNIFTCLGT